MKDVGTHFLIGITGIGIFSHTSSPTKPLRQSRVRVNNQSLISKTPSLLA